MVEYVSFRIRIEPRVHTDGFEVCVSAGEEQFSKPIPLEIDFSSSSRLAGVINDIKRDDCDFDELKDVGAQLWAGLLMGKNEAQFRKLVDQAKDRPVQIRLETPPTLAHLPWECVYDERFDQFLAISSKYCLIRDVPGIDAQPNRAEEHETISLLVAIPEGSRLSTDHEWNNIKRILQNIDDRVEVKRLEGRVTIGRIDADLRRGTYDIFHFIGHGEVDSDREVAIRLNSDEDGSEEFWVSGEQFAQLFDQTKVQLAFLNCCYGGQSSPKRKTSGLGPALLVRGVPSVVAMQFEINDTQAVRFSETFYRALLNGPFAGHVSIAVQEARRDLHLNCKPSTRRGFITPTLFLRAGCDPLFKSAPRQKPPPPVIDAPLVGMPVIEIPEGLCNAVKGGRCIPVVGHLFFANDETRRAPSAPGPLRLARLLAGKCGFPGTSEFELAKEMEPWLCDTVLQRVCEYYISEETEIERIDLTEQIRDIFAGLDPPRAFASLTRWSAPGAICTYFDGLLVEAFERKRQRPLIVSSTDQPAEEMEDAFKIVHVCGLPTDPESLVLTETDHDQLFDRLEQPGGSLTGLINSRFGHSILLLGVSPRDPLVRRLCSILLRADRGRRVVPIYFAAPNPDVTDQLFWRQFNVTWIDADTDELVDALTVIATGGDDG